MSKNRERAEHVLHSFLPIHLVHERSIGLLAALLDDVERARDREWRLGLSGEHSGLVPGHMLDHIKAALDRAKAESYEEAREQAARSVEADATVSLFDGSTKPERNYHKRRSEPLARAIRAMKPGGRG